MDSLPIELLYVIIDHLDKLTDRLRFLATCHHIYDNCLGQAYQSMFLNGPRHEYIKRLPEFMMAFWEHHDLVRHIEVEYCRAVPDLFLEYLNSFENLTSFSFTYNIGYYTPENGYYSIISCVLPLRHLKTFKMNLARGLDNNEVSFRSRGGFNKWPTTNMNISQATWTPEPPDLWDLLYAGKEWEGKCDLPLLSTEECCRLHKLVIKMEFLMPVTGVPPLEGLPELISIMRFLSPAVGGLKELEFRFCVSKENSGIMEMDWRGYDRYLPVWNLKELRRLKVECQGLAASIFWRLVKWEDGRLERNDQRYEGFGEMKEITFW